MRAGKPFLFSRCGQLFNGGTKAGIDFAKSRGKKVYVAANVIMKNNDIESLYSFAKNVYDLGADSIILSDLGAFDVVKSAAPNLKIHISTQANTTNFASANAWHKLGASRVVISREISGEGLRHIRKNTDPSLEIEVFVHGAMCISYSKGLIRLFNGRDANYASVPTLVGGSII